jgi:outer membrane protein assembly factor BamE (lipoprotein component of BamABCDE complex)
LAGCGAGKNFTVPAKGSLQLGVTTPQQATTMLGDPVSKSSSTVAAVETGTAPPAPSIFTAVKVPGTYDNLIYAYIDTVGQQLAGPFAGVRPMRTLHLEFLNGKLIGYSASSSFDNDSTNFDDGKVGRIERGKTNRNDVTNLFGTPAGELLFPLISTPKGHVALYNYAEDNISKRERATKFLAVYFDEGGIVRDFESTNATNPLPMPAPTATTVVPIVIPRGK